MKKQHLYALYMDPSVSALKAWKSDILLTGLWLTARKKKKEKKKGTFILLLEICSHSHTLRQALWICFQVILSEYHPMFMHSMIVTPAWL